MFSTLKSICLTEEYLAIKVFESKIGYTHGIHCTCTVPLGVRIM